MIMNFKRLKSWLRDIFLWVYEARLALWFIIVLLMAFLFGFCMWSSEQSIRTSGFGLQIIGMVFAINGLLKIRDYFDQSTLIELSFAWWHRFPKWEKHCVIETKGGTIVITGMGTRIEVWASDNPEDSLEKRIDGVVKSLERLKEEQKNISDKFDELQGNQEKNQKEHDLAIVNVEKKSRADLKSSQTDGILESLIGLVWLTFGISMSTMSQELSNYKDYLCFFSWYGC